MLAFEPKYLEQMGVLIRRHRLFPLRILVNVERSIYQWSRARRPIQLVPLANSVRILLLWSGQPLASLHMIFDRPKAPSFLCLKYPFACGWAARYRSYSPVFPRRGRERIWRRQTFKIHQGYVKPIAPMYSKAVQCEKSMSPCSLHRHSYLSLMYVYIIH
jgi:hypothetical protein